MVKAGIYLVARCTIIFGGTPEWFWLVSGIGLITLLYGSINALKQNDLKALLAYSTISQLGLIMTLLGLGSAALHFVSAPQGAIYSIAIFAAIFHLFNHSTFKGCLFMVVGIIDHELGTRDIRRLGGLLHLMPVSFVLTLTGSLAMAGLPPFNGFLSKELFFTALINAAQMPVFNMPYWGTIVAFLAWFASVLTFVYCLTILLKTFMGRAKGHKLKKKPREASMGMLISPFILATLVIGSFITIGFLNICSFRLRRFPYWPARHVGLCWPGISAELLMTLE